MIWLVVKYILAAAVRDKILLSFLLLIGVGVSLSLFLGSAAVSEKDQFSIVFAASTLRLSSLFTLILFVVFYTQKSFDTHDVEYMLSRPISRFQYLAAHTISFSILAFILTALSIITLFFMPSTIDTYGLALWGGSLLIELVLIANVALFFSFVLTSAVSTMLITFSFYVLARMMGGILGVIATTPEAGTMLVMEKLMLLISIIIPRLDLMGQGSWLLYGVEGPVGWSFILGQGFVFLGLVFSATLIDFKRKQF
jgi:hypothetical protein